MVYFWYDFKYILEVSEGAKASIAPLPGSLVQTH